jgi:hypothetical protein
MADNLLSGLPGTPNLQGHLKPAGILYSHAFASVTAAERALMTATAGLCVLNTDTGKLNFYTGAGWEVITSA